MQMTRTPASALAFDLHMNTLVGSIAVLLLALLLLSSHSFHAVSADSTRGSSDYYKRLGIDRKKFDKSALRKAYYELAKKYHPDKNRDDKAAAEKKFKEITQAFEVLNDDEKRKIYDVHGEDGLRDGFGGDANFNAQDIFERFFGGGGGGGGGFNFFGGQHMRPRTADVRVQYKISLEEVYKGATLEVRVPPSAHPRSPRM